MPYSFWNLHDIIFIIFIDHCQVNWVAKSICFCHAKSWDCLLTHWLQMKSIPSLRETINYTNSDTITSETKKLFLNFLLHFWNAAEILRILRKKMMLIDSVISKLRTAKTYSDKCLKRPGWEIPLKNNMVNVQKHCWNLHNNTFILFIGHLQVTGVRKSLSYWHAKSWDCFLTQWLPIKRILLLNKDNLTIPIQMQLSQKQKLFSELFATFLKSTINFKYFEKRIWSLSILYFRNYGLRKRGEINVLKIPVSEDPSRSNMVNVPKHCSNLHHSFFFHIHWPLPSQLSWKTSLLLTCQIFWLLVNTLAADGKYPVLNRDNLTIPTQMQLSRED